MTEGLFSNLPREIRRRLLYTVAAIFAAILLGGIGFHLIEGFTLLESIYLATETVTTVGYGDFAPRTSAGRVFAIIFMLAGVGTVLYSLTSFAQSVIQAKFLANLDIRRMRKEMEKLTDHYVVCGAGRVGRRIIRTLERQGISYVAIERDENKVRDMIDEKKQFMVIGDATLDENLRLAGVERARGLVTCLANDADNVYVVLTARGMNSKLHIVSRAVEEEAETKLIRAGANRVVSPTIIGSLSMARALVKPAIADFMDSIVAESLDLVFEEVAIRPDSTYVGKKLRETNIRSELDLVVIALRRKSGEMIFQPSGEIQIDGGDLLIVIGRAEPMSKLLGSTK